MPHSCVFQPQAVNQKDKKLLGCPTFIDQQIRKKKSFFLRIWISFVCHHWKRSPGKKMTKFLHHPLPHLKHNTLYAAPCTVHFTITQNALGAFKKELCEFDSECFSLNWALWGLSTMSLKTAAVPHQVLLSHLLTPADEGVTQRTINGALSHLTCTAKTTVFL